MRANYKTVDIGLKTRAGKVFCLWKNGWYGLLNYKQKKVSVQRARVKNHVC